MPEVHEDKYIFIVKITQYIYTVRAHHHRHHRRHIINKLRCQAQCLYIYASRYELNVHTHTHTYRYNDTRFIYNNQFLIRVVRHWRDQIIRFAIATFNPRTLFDRKPPSQCVYKRGPINFRLFRQKSSIFIMITQFLVGIIMRSTRRPQYT